LVIVGLYVPALAAVPRLRHKHILAGLLRLIFKTWDPFVLPDDDDWLN
jgi:hypothetical protein